MSLQPKRVIGILAGPKLRPGNPGLTLSQMNWEPLGTGSEDGTGRAGGVDQHWAQPAFICVGTCW